MVVNSLTNIHHYVSHVVLWDTIEKEGNTVLHEEKRQLHEEVLDFNLL